MFSAKNILSALYERFNADDDGDQLKILNSLQEAYYELCSSTSWEVLRDPITYEYDADIDGMWLPSDVVGIDAVTNGIDIWKESGQTASLDASSCEKRWFIAETSRLPLVSGTGINVSTNESTFTDDSGLITSDHIGEFIRIGGVNELYQIKSTTELMSAYGGEEQFGAEFQVRPVGTQRIKLLAEYSATDKTAGVTIFCWRLPRQIHGDSGLCLLPRADILELATAEKIYGSTRETEMKNSVQKDLYGSKGRYAGKLELAIANNPDFIPPSIPRNKHGRVAGFGAR